MSLRPRADVAPADWFVQSQANWQDLVGFGPPGFDSYARVFFEVDEDGDLRSDHEVFADLVSVVAAHTSTPDDAFFGLWDGYSDIHGGDRLGYVFFGPGARALAALSRLTRPLRRRIPPAFAPEVIDGPKVVVENREFYLFSGPLAHAGDWGAAPIRPGWGRDISTPSLMWPADHAWFVASDTDPDWIGVGGSEDLITALLTDPRLDAETAVYGLDYPESR